MHITSSICEAKCRCKNDITIKSINERFVSGRGLINIEMTFYERIHVRFDECDKGISSLSVASHREADVCA